MNSDSSTFSPKVYQVCMYCKHVQYLITEGHGGGDFVYACGVRRRANDKSRGEEWMIRIGLDYHDRDVGAGALRIGGFSGCSQFEASGLEVHPDVREVMVRRNPLSSEVPTNLSATETGRDFDFKVAQKIGKEISFDERLY